MFPSAENLASDAAGEYFSTTPRHVGMRSRHATVDHRMSQLHWTQAAIFVDRQCARDQRAPCV